jgi:hypothetical protein
MTVETIAGTYIDITRVTAPSEAEEGNTVRLGVTLTAKTDIRYAHPRVYGDGVSLLGSSRTLYSGRTNHWAFSFVMPDKDIKLTIDARYWSSVAHAWQTGDTKKITISLAAPTSTEWIEVARRYITVEAGVTPTAPTEWVEVTSTTIRASVFAAPTEWVEVATTEIGVSFILSVTQWIEVVKVEIPVALFGYTPPIPPPKECKSGEINIMGHCVPWWLVGGGIATGAAGIGVAVLKRKKV